MRQPILKNRAAPEIEQKVVQLALDQPAWGQPILIGISFVNDCEVLRPFGNVGCHYSQIPSTWLWLLNVYDFDVIQVVELQTGSTSPVTHVDIAIR